MNEELEDDFVRATYQKMSDKEIICVLTQDAAGLTPEALRIVQDEVKRRNLDSSLDRSILAQQKTFTLQEIDELCGIIQKLPCPRSGNTFDELNATCVAKVFSIIFFTHYDRKIIVACPAELDRANKHSLIFSFFLGWWGIPWGIIRTVQAISINLKGLKTNHYHTPNKYLRAFVLHHVGEIVAFRDHPDKLMDLIRNI